jgi:hypothetical protein
MTFISVETACSVMVSGNVSETPVASIFRAVTSHFYYPEDWGSSLTYCMPWITLILEEIYLMNFIADWIIRREMARCD